jgi:hypothetical protein
VAGHLAAEHTRRSVGLFCTQNAFQHHPCRRVIIPKIADQLTVMLNRDAFSRKVLACHINQIIALGILRTQTTLQRLRRTNGDKGALSPARPNRVMIRAKAVRAAVGRKR